MCRSRLQHKRAFWTCWIVYRTLDSLSVAVDPDVPFVPSPVPYGNHVLSYHEEMEIQCRVSDPTANVTLVNVDTQRAVPCTYDSKRGALGVFTAGTYVCKAVVRGVEHYSEEYIVHGWMGGGGGLHVELTAKQTALLVGDTITVTCLAQGSEILDDHWKYPGKAVRTERRNDRLPEMKKPTMSHFIEEFVFSFYHIIYL